MLIDERLRIDYSTVSSRLYVADLSNPYKLDVGRCLGIFVSFEISLTSSVATKHWIQNDAGFAQSMWLDLPNHSLARPADRYALRQQIFSFFRDCINFIRGFKTLNTKRTQSPDDKYSSLVETTENTYTVLITTIISLRNSWDPNHIVLPQTDKDTVLT